MQLTLRRKIYAIPLVTLVPMLASIAVSQHLLAEARDDVRLVAERLVPTAIAIGEIDTLIERQASLLDRSPDIAVFRRAGDAVRARLQKAETLLGRPEPSSDVVGRSIWLAGHVAEIGKAHRAYAEAARAVIESAPAGPDAQATMRLRKGELGRQVASVRLTIDALAQDSARRAETHASFALRLNIILAAIAAALGLGMATTVGRRLLATVRRVTEGIRQVGGGRRDVTVSAATRDEAGYLADCFNDMVEALRRRERSGNG